MCPPQSGPTNCFFLTGALKSASICTKLCNTETRSKLKRRARKLLHNVENNHHLWNMGKVPAFVWCHLPYAITFYPTRPPAWGMLYFPFLETVRGTQRLHMAHWASCLIGEQLRSKTKSTSAPRAAPDRTVAFSVLALLSTLCTLRLSLGLCDFALDAICGLCLLLALWQFAAAHLLRGCLRCSPSWLLVPPPKATLPLSLASTLLHGAAAKLIITFY